MTFSCHLCYVVIPFIILIIAIDNYDIDWLHPDLIPPTYLYWVVVLIPFAILFLCLSRCMYDPLSPCALIPYVSHHVRLFGCDCLDPFPWLISISFRFCDHQMLCICVCSCSVSICAHNCDHVMCIATWRDLWTVYWSTERRLVIGGFTSINARSKSI
jgi:hypothetical protein